MGCIKRGKMQAIIEAGIIVCMFIYLFCFCNTLKANECPHATFFVLLHDRIDDSQFVKRKIAILVDENASTEDMRNHAIKVYDNRIAGEGNYFYQINIRKAQYGKILARLSNTITGHQYFQTFDYEDD